jgi:antitoxin HicB
MRNVKKKSRQKRETLYKLPLVLDPQPEGGYTVTCPLLPELITEGDTAREALGNVTDALAALLEAYQTLGRPVPPAIKQSAVATPLWLETVIAVS